MFKLKDSSENKISFVRENLEQVKKIMFVKAIRIVVNKERAEHSYDLAMILAFDSMEDMKKYLIHPIHKDDVVVKTSPYIQNIAVIDLSGDAGLLDSKPGVYRHIIMLTLPEKTRGNEQIFSELSEKIGKLPLAMKMVELPNIVESSRNADRVWLLDVEKEDQIMARDHADYIQSIIFQLVLDVKEVAIVSYSADFTLKE